MIPPPADWSSHPRRIVGLMSGTSLDGVDAALVEVQGGIPPAGWRLLAFHTRAYTAEERARMAALMAPEVALRDLTLGNAWLGEVFADAALAVIAAAGLTPAEVDAIASHGQTVWHVPPEDGQPGATLQLGAPAVIAERTELLTVADFRPRDMAAGGQGAPLVPFADYLLLRSGTVSRVVLNIGGIANLTYLPAGCTPADVIAFDTGPGNMVIDALVAHYTGGTQAYDVDGALAAQGWPREDLVDSILATPFFWQSPPKSTGREEFGVNYAEWLLEVAELAQISVIDMIASATLFTAASIADAIRRFVFPRGAVDEVIIGGGGAHNPTLLALLSQRLPGIPLRRHEEFGIPGDAKEALAFALLGHATLCGAPGNIPAATGASHPVVLGSITPGPPLPPRG
jgi:anhydro-N-acetylmuramic acid kinase